MKHVVRNEGDACFSFSTSVVSCRVYLATALCCGACHVNVKPKSTEEKSSLNFTRLSSVVENIQRRTKTYASKSTLPGIRKDEVEPFVP